MTYLAFSSMMAVSTKVVPSAGEGVPSKTPTESGVPAMALSQVCSVPPAGVYFQPSSDLEPSAGA